MVLILIEFQCNDKAYQMHEGVLRKKKLFGDLYVQLRRAKVIKRNQALFRITIDVKAKTNVKHFRLTCNSQSDQPIGYLWHIGL